MPASPISWITFESLSNPEKERIEILYPYLKIQNYVFQSKDSGVFMRQENGVKIEKLLDPSSMQRKAPALSQEERAPRESEKRTLKKRRLG